jgi:hypothetical protein
VQINQPIVQINQPIVQSSLTLRHNMRLKDKPEFILSYLTNGFFP